MRFEPTWAVIFCRKHSMAMGPPQHRGRDRNEEVEVFPMVPRPAGARLSLQPWHPSSSWGAGHHNWAQGRTCLLEGLSQPKEATCHSTLPPKPAVTLYQQLKRKLFLKKSNSPTFYFQFHRAFSSCCSPSLPLWCLLTGALLYSLKGQLMIAGGVITIPTGVINHS